MNMDLIGTFEKRGNISGKLHIKPSSGLLEETMGTVFNAELIVELSGNKQQTDMNVDVRKNGHTMLLVDCKTSAIDAQEIVIPQNAVNMTDETALTAWTMGIDVANLITALSEAGFPVELLMGAMIGG